MKHADPSQATLPARRLVLLGASNLTKGIGTVLDTANRVWGGPLEVHAALGHGRSYGRQSRFFGLQLPGIAACGLWRDLAESPELPTAALVTDIGNDLLYEQPVARIVGWLETCLDRLEQMQARTVVTRLPIDNLNRISAAKFHLLRRLYFPWSRITLAEATGRAVALDAAVTRLAAERGHVSVGHQTSWYGFDPIHFRFTRRGEAWREILGGWAAESSSSLVPATSAIARTVFLRTRTPHARRVLGIAQRGLQPAARFRDGTTVSIY